MIELSPSERTLPHVVKKAAELYPDRVWIATHDRELTYAQCDDDSDKLAQGLGDMGIKRGDPVLVMLPDIPEFITTWCAIAKWGAIEVPLNVALRGDLLSHIVNDSRAEFLIVHAGYLGAFAQIMDRFENLRSLIIFGEADEETAGHLQQLAERLDVHRFDDLYSVPRKLNYESTAPQDNTSIMYTSGTTGPSKGVMISHAFAFEYGCAGAEILELTSEDVYYTAGLPLFHIAGKWGVCYAAALKGCKVGLARKFSPTDFWNDIEIYGGTTVYLLGAMANLLYRQDPKPNDAETPLKKVAMCPLIAEHEAFEERFGLKVCTAFGSTEANAVLYIPFEEKITDKQIVGRPRDKFEVTILDKNDEQVPPGQMGEIAVRPKEPWLVMSGYWNRPEQTCEAWRNLWLHTGDAGKKDSDGNFYFIDRIKDAIRRRGENISSMEVEKVVNQHPSVLECAVFPIDSEFTEQEVMVAIALKDDRQIDPEELIKFLEPRMPYYMVPRYIEIVDTLPKTETGKIQKYEFRKRGITDATWDREAAGIKIRK